MMSDDDFKNHECSNMFRCLMALKHLRDSLIVFCEEIVKQHHASLLKKLPEIKDSCEHCTLEKLLPFHLYEKKACPSQSKRKCFCSKKAGRQLCPNDGFCSKFFDLIVLEHRFRDPLWKNTDPRKWKDCPWSVAVCFINTQGYHDKGTADDTDCRGLLSIIINNLKFETELQEITINGVNDIFKKARDLANLVHHSSNYEITDETTQSCMELVKSILQIQSINVADLLQKNESILSSSEGDLADQLPTDTESKEGSVTGTGLICSTDAINAMKEDVEGVQMSPPGAVHQDCCVRSNPDDVTDPQITDVSQHMTGAMKEDVEALPISKPHAVQQACSVRSNPDEVPEPQIMEASQRMSDAMQEDVEAVQISLPGAVHQDCSVRSNPDDVTDPQITDVSQHMTGAMKEDAEALPISQRHAVHQACSVRSNPEEVPEPKIMEASQRMSGKYFTLALATYVPLFDYTEAYLLKVCLKVGLVKSYPTQNHRVRP
ncbi:uncharacterized protein LOC128553169 [Mercenaria mercenaria]|uniref:uncharacterized protein LOC128553169 n=1 Tax=Mercenaria mercenaria TaxID=6596 RepID=UPI00234EB613|nr:uncharacterized protein LOC128553169 [Mercenaria mercenaria]